MLSIAILSISLILILQGFTHSLNILRISQNNLETTLLAEGKMAEIEINAKHSKDIFSKDLGGELQSNNIEFKWEIRMAPEEEYEDLNKVLTTISWKEGKRKGAIPLATYLRTPSRTR